MSTHRALSGCIQQPVSDKQSDDGSTFVCFSFWCHRRQQRNRLSHRIHRSLEKSQRQLVVPWGVIIHPTVVLTLLTVSCAICNSDLGSLALPNGITAPRWWWGELVGVPGGGPPRDSFTSCLPISLRPTLLSKGCSFFIIPFMWS